jgi:hypothetical protein
MSYPKALPEGNLRDPNTFKGRMFEGGYPISDDVARWVHKRLVPVISANLQQVAADTGIDFLDVQNALLGHELGSRGTHRAGDPIEPGRFYSGEDRSAMEWFRFLTVGGLSSNQGTSKYSQGHYRESFHPNYYGQLQLGACLKGMWRRIGFGTRQAVGCSNRPDQADSLEFKPLDPPHPNLIPIRDPDSIPKFRSRTGYCTVQ